MIEYIRQQLPETELLAQLAEEASELAQAALKLRRVLDGKNPTPKKLCEAMADIHEEIADVQLVLEVLNLGGYADHSELRKAKLLRWVKRLRENGYNPSVSCADSSLCTREPLGAAMIGRGDEHER